VYFLNAIDIARKQQAKSLELRGSKPGEAMAAARQATRNALSEIYGWFAEGFDTKDLQEAKALLDELA
jgi:predicted ATPase